MPLWWHFVTTSPKKSRFFMLRLQMADAGLPKAKSNVGIGIEHKCLCSPARNVSNELEPRKLVGVPIRNMHVDQVALERSTGPCESGLSAGLRWPGSLARNCGQGTRSKQHDSTGNILTHVYLTSRSSVGARVSSELSTAALHGNEQSIP